MSPRPLRGFSLARVYVVALRIVRQLKRDKRTVGLITLAPIFLMTLFGYALSGDMSGIMLGIVDSDSRLHNDGRQDLPTYAVLDHLRTFDGFDILHLGSESDAERLIRDGMLRGAVIIDGYKIRVLLDGSSPQISSAIMAQVEAGANEGAGRSADYVSSRPGSLAGVSSTMAISTPSATAPEIATGPLEITKRYIYGYDLKTMDSVGPAVLGLTVFFFTFIMSTISFLRERTQGTMEKFMVSPLSRLEMVSGYLVGFSLFTVVQSATTLLVVVYGFDIPMKGSPLTAFAVILLLGAGALGLGAVFSNFASSEFQVVQFIPMVILPQVVLTGVWWPLESIPDFIRPLSYLLPLTYSSDALRAVMLRGATLTDILVPDLMVLILFFAVVFTVATLMLRREVG